MKKEIEKKIWFFTILVIVFGLVALYSASFDNVRVSQKVFFDQVLCAVAGVVVMYLCSLISYRKWYDGAYAFYVVMFIVLLGVLIAGRHALGARRWLEVGTLSFQPSEFAKIALILTLARYLSNRRPMLSFDFRSRLTVLVKELIIPFCFTCGLMFWIFKQPDLGSALLLFAIFLVMVFVNDLEMRFFVGFISVSVFLMPFAWHVLKSYQKDRLLVFLNPNKDPLGAGYTIIQSKIAVGSGQLLGKGWLAGTQNQLNFLPERHTDFIFSVIAEEWGFLGVLFLLVCYFYIIHLGMNIAASTKDRFGALLAVGLVSILAVQVIVNIGMVIGILPIVGLTLPFVSYGRSSFLVFMIMLGILLNINRKSISL